MTEENLKIFINIIPWLKEKIRIIYSFINQEKKEKKRLILWKAII